MMVNGLFEDTLRVVVDNCLSHTASCDAELRAIYSASEVDKATIGCFLLSQLIGPLAIMNKLPVVE